MKATRGQPFHQEGDSEAAKAGSGSKLSSSRKNFKLVGMPNQGVTKSTELYRADILKQFFKAADPFSKPNSRKTVNM